MKNYSNYLTSDLIREFLDLLASGQPIPTDLEATLIERGIDTSKLYPIVRIYIDGGGVVHSTSPHLY
jgi:hypothetical protein